MPDALPEPLVVCIHHPAAPDLDKLRARLCALPRPVEILSVPWKESLAIRRERAQGRRPAEPAAAASQPDDRVLDAWRRAEVVLALDLPGEHLSALPRLRWVQAYSSGVDHFDRRALTERGIVLTSAAGVGAVPIAEFVLGRLLEVWKESRSLESMQRARTMRRVDSRLLSGSTLGIIGFGAIGRALGERAHALGMRIVANRRHPEAASCPEWVDAMHGPEGLAEILAQADAVVLSAPDAPETRDLIDAAALRAMRPGSVLCNVSRGALVDEAALIEALSSGRLRAAILDVTRNEPLDPDDPLFAAPNLYLSPHCAVSPEAYDERLLELLARNLERHVASRPLLNAV